MYVARVVVVLILILFAVLAYSPLAREQAAHAWEEIGPAMAAFIDRFYVAFQDFISSDDSSEPAEDVPVPGPGGDFERIVTQNGGSCL